MNIPDDLNIGDAVEYIETAGNYNYHGIAIFLGTQEDGYYKFLFAKLHRQDAKNFSTYEVPNLKKIFSIHPEVIDNAVTLRKLLPNETVDFQ